jgi:hypothetical protein
MITPAMPTAGVMIGFSGRPLLPPFREVALFELVGRAIRLVVDGWSEDVELITVFEVSELDDAVMEELADPEAVDAGAKPEPLADVEEGTLLEFASLVVIEASARLWT